MKTTKTNRKLWSVRLALSTGLALLFIVILLWGLRGMTPAHANPGTLYVDGAAGQDILTCGTTIAPCQTISYTLNSRASDGDTIRVAQATYTENLTIDISVTLEGGYEATGWTRDIAAYVTTIDGSGSNNSTVDIQNATVAMEGFTITGGNSSGSSGGGLNAWGSSITISNTTFVSNTTTENGGGLRTGDTDLTIIDSRIEGNRADQCGGGVWHGQSGTLRMVNTIVAGNGSGGCGGGIMPFQTSLELINSTVAANYNIGGGGSGGIWVDFDNQVGRHVTVTNSIVWDNRGCDLCIGNDPNPTPLTVEVSYSDVDGGAWWDGTLLTGTGNIDANPWFVDSANGDYHLQAWSPAIDAGTATGAPDYDFEGDARPQNAGYDMGADEFVGTPVSNQGDRYVATTGSDAGPNLCIDNTTPCQTIGQALDMANAGESVLVAQGTYTENLTVSMPVTLTGGYESAGWTRSITQYETIINGSGSVISQPVIAIRDGSDGTVLDGLTITGGNGQEAGGVAAGGSEVTIKNCLIRDNFGNGMPDHSGAGGVVGGGNGKQLTIIDSRIVNNRVNGGAGGVRSYDGLLVLINSIVADNHGDPGVHANGPVSLMNTTVSNNDGGILFNPLVSATLVVTNSIVYSTGFSIADVGSGTTQIAYSDIQGGWTGTGNVDADPLFVGSSDYHLQVGSPAIDAGTAAGAPAYDIEGTLRGAVPDMGAYEWTSPIFLPLIFRNFGP